MAVLLLVAMAWFLPFILHLDVYLNESLASLGLWLYPVLFLIIFCETGLVITPFLPGDSLLFALGTLAAGLGSPLNLPLLAFVLFIAAVLGDAFNYLIGNKIGERLFKNEKSRWLKKKHYLATRAFYEKHGGKTIVLARFIPIIRTFAPFVAGVGEMGYRRFAIFNIAGGLLWVLLLLGAGFYFGNIPIVRENFELAILGIIFVSLLPLLIKFLSK